jgi:hypothetical protein
VSAGAVSVMGPPGWASGPSEFNNRMHLPERAVKGSGAH